MSFSDSRLTMGESAFCVMLMKRSLYFAGIVSSLTADGIAAYTPVSGGEMFVSR